jgi:hypothetical protein
MRIVFGVLSLLVVVAVIGILAKKQLGAMAPAAPAVATSPGSMAAPSGTPQQQVQQFRQAVEQAVQPPRPMPEDK